MSGKRYAHVTRMLRADERRIRLPILAWAAPLALALVAALLLVSATAVRAQAGPAGSAQVLTPSQVVVAGAIGDLEQRTVVLRLPSTATNLQFMAQDLTSASGTSVLPSSAISATLPFLMGSASAPTVTVTNLLTFTVKIDLAQAPAGSFTGQALVLYTRPVGAGLPAEQVEAPLALTVSAKHSWPLPAFILLGGVLLGMALTIIATTCARATRCWRGWARCSAASQPTRSWRPRILQLPWAHLPCAVAAGTSSALPSRLP